VTGIYKTAKPKLKELSEGGSLDRAYMGEREVYFGKRDGFKAVPIYKRELLPRDSLIIGPAVIEEITATTIIPINFRAKVDKYGNLIITHE